MHLTIRRYDLGHQWLTGPPIQVQAMEPRISDMDGSTTGSRQKLPTSQRRGSSWPCASPASASKNGCINGSIPRPSEPSCFVRLGPSNTSRADHQRVPEDVRHDGDAPSPQRRAGQGGRALNRCPSRAYASARPRPVPGVPGAVGRSLSIKADGTCCAWSTRPSPGPPRRCRSAALWLLAADARRRKAWRAWRGPLRRPREVGDAS